MVALIPYITIAWLVPAFPLLGFLITGIAKGRLKNNQAGIIASSMVSLSFIASVLVFFILRSSHQESATITLFNWIAAGDLKIPFAFLIDHLSVTMMLIVTGVGALIHIYSIGYMHDDGRVNSFFAQMNLFYIQHVTSCDGGKLPYSLYRMGRGRILFLPVDWVLVQKP